MCSYTHLIDDKVNRGILPKELSWRQCHFRETAPVRVEVQNGGGLVKALQSI